MTEEIQKISIEDRNYPKLLKEIKSALVVLEIKGKVKNLGGNIYAISHS